LFQKILGNIARFLLVGDVVESAPNRGLENPLNCFFAPEKQKMLGESAVWDANLIPRLAASPRFGALSLLCRTGQSQ